MIIYLIIGIIWALINVCLTYYYFHNTGKSPNKKNLIIMTGIHIFLFPITIVLAIYYTIKGMVI